MKTLWIHIGMPKTGTTALQEFLDINQATLRQEGFLYRRMPFSYRKDQSQISGRRNGYFLHGLAETARGYDPARVEAEREEGFQILEQWFRETDRILLTDENLWTRIQEGETYLDHLRRYRDRTGREIRIVVYLRPQEEFLESLYRQRVDGNAAVQVWDEFREQMLPSLDYPAKLHRITQALGKEALRVRVYQTSLVRADPQFLFSDFMETIGTALREGYQIPEQLRNQSLDRDGVELKRIMNRSVREDQDKSLDGKRFLKNAAMESRYPFVDAPEISYFSTEELLAFRERFREGNQQIARDYLDREELFQLNERELIKWDPDPARLQERLICFLATALTTQQKELRALQEELESRTLRGFLRRIRKKWKEKTLA